MKVAILGGTGGMGRALARQMAGRGDRVFLLGHLPDELERSARDLEVRSKQRPVGTAHCDLEQPDTFGPALERALGEALSRRVSLGSGAPVFARVATFEEGPAGAEGAAWRVALSITVELEGVGCVEEAGVRASPGGGHEQVTLGRSQAVETLCQELAESAVARLLAGEGTLSCR